VLERESGVEGRAHHAGALLQALNALELVREGVVLHKIWLANLVEDLEPTLVHDLLVQTLNRPLVLLLLLRHLVLLLLTSELNDAPLPVALIHPDDPRPEPRAP
jgi:hypothetical protein